MGGLENPSTYGPSEVSPLIAKAATIVSPQDCRQHLKLLKCFFNLKQAVSEAKGVFKAEHSHDIRTELNAETRRSIIKERRWSIYLSRAIYRFSIWRSYLPVSNGQSHSSGQTFEKQESHGENTWEEDKMPPLDVLMVLHAAMLHGKAFAEDCLRHQKMALWKQGFPLQLATKRIDQDTLTYTCSEAAKLHFEQTGLAWDNIHDPDDFLIECFRCHEQTQVPWTTRRQRGFADDRFIQQCRICKFVQSRESLLVQKLRRDLHSLFEENIPLPGACPNIYDDIGSRASPNVLSNKLLRDFLLEETRPTNLFPDMTRIVEASAKATGVQDISVLHGIFSHYQYVSSSSCDLCAAVKRISEWISTVQGRDWSSMTGPYPPLVETQYTRFLQQWSKSSRGIRINDTTDSIILIWSTHQLKPRDYSRFSGSICNGVLIDWEPAHQSTRCKLCSILQPASFARRFLQSITFPVAWLPGL